MSEYEKGRISLFKVRPVGDKLLTQTGELFDAESYSRFKYGSGEIAAEYGFSLANLVAERQEKLLNNGAELVITSSAFKHLPTASYAVAVNLHSAINHRLFQEGREASGNIKIHRHTLIEGDYGKMSESERAENMRKNQLSVDRESIEGKHLLVVDDVRITGSHERRIEEAVADLDLLSLWFLYAVEMDAEAAMIDPTIENRMNHALVKDLSSLADVIATKNFLLNARTCKYVLQWNNEDELRTFFAGMDNDFLHTMYTGILGDGYGFMDSYKNSLGILRETLEQRNLLIHGNLMPPPSALGTSRYTRHMDLGKIVDVVSLHNERQQKENEKTNNPYNNSVAVETLKNADQEGKRAEIVIVNHSLYEENKRSVILEANRLRTLVDEQGLFILTTEKPPEMLISERTRLNSDDFSRPVPHYGTESDTNKRIYIDPAHATAAGMIDAPVLIAANGTQVYMLQEENGEKYYLEDKEFQATMEASSEHWRESVLKMIHMIDPRGELGTLSIVESHNNYTKGATRYAPPDYRIMFHISSPVADPEMNKTELNRQRKKKSIQKRDRFMRKLTTLQATYTEYRDLYQMLIIDHDPDPEDLLESRLYELEHTLEDAGIRAVYDKNITSHDLQNIRIITDSDPNSGKMSLHFVPQNAGEKNAINWVMGKLMTTASINPPVVTFIADKFMDVEAALASQNQTASFTSRILIPSSSAISNPLMTALNVLQGEEERGARTTMDFIHSGLQNLAREISSSLDKAPHEASQIQFTDLQATEISTELQSLLTSDHVITPV